MVNFERADRALKQRITSGPRIGCGPRCVVVPRNQGDNEEDIDIKIIDDGLR